MTNMRDEWALGGLIMVILGVFLIILPVVSPYFTDTMTIVGFIWLVGGLNIMATAIRSSK